MYPEWSKPYPPFQIAGNLYYVGTYDLACYLIVTPKGNILINTGLASSAPVIKKSIETLGFKLSVTKILLNTQAHFDHMGVVESRPGPADGNFPSIIEVEDRHKPIGGASLLKRTAADGSGVTDLSTIDKVRRLPRRLHR